jgi:cell division protein FtsZ
MAKKKKKKIKKALLKTAIVAAAPASELVKRTKIRVIGIGGGGGTIVSEIASRIQKASFAAANTDIQALRATSRKISRFQFGQNLTRGLGTGMNAELGEQAAESEKDRIKKLLAGQDLCILVACLGGGAGSGASSVIARISKNLGNLTYGIFTLPFKFEGERKMEIAKNALEKIKTHLNAITVIPNERVFQTIDKNTPLKMAFSAVNRNLADSLEGLIETIYEPGLINIDFADFRTILKDGGKLAYLNTAEVPKKEGAVKDLILKALNSPLYPYSIKGAKGVLFNITGEKDLSLSDVNQISETIYELANPEAKIIFGIAQNRKNLPNLKITLLATGCGMKLFPGEGKKKKRKPVAVKKAAIRKKRIRRRKKVDIKEKKKEPLIKSILKIKKRIIKPRKAKIKEENPPQEQKPKEERVHIPVTDEKIRKSALQIKRETEDAEKEMEEQEKLWETPAFLRKKLIKDN